MSDTNSEPRLVRFSDLAADWERDAIEAHDARINNRPRGPVSGLPQLDTILGGNLQRGSNVLHGGPGAGKTALALQIAGSCECPSLYATFEMSVLELARRVTARETGTYLGRLKSGEFTPRDSLALFRQACAHVPLLTFADCTETLADVGWLQQAATAARGDHRHILIVMDSVHSWAETATGAGVSEYDALNAALARLRGLAASLGCAVLAVAERNRASMQSGGLSAGAGTRKFEYGAEAVIDLARPKDAREDASGEVDVVLKLEKNRHGAAGGEVRLRFHGALQRFREAVP